MSYLAELWAFVSFLAGFACDSAERPVVVDGEREEGDVRTTMLASFAVRFRYVQVER